ncbi:MAG: hypothetical protein QOD74_362, partial [Variibacter sp.]|nr:hypothetical protein [Variibacter sp.]
MVVRAMCRDERGSVLPIFALAILPIFGFMGAAIDFSRASSARAEMQAALDATALMVSRDPVALSNGTYQAKALAQFQAQYNRPEAQNVQITASYSNTSGSTLKVDGTGKLPARFMKLIGVSSMDFSSSSTVRWGQTKLRVALALDNTGSMLQAGKMAALKTASLQLLAQLQTAGNSGDVQVSLVPFSKSVNVGKNNYTADWISWDEWDDENGHDVSTTTCTNSKGKGKKCKTSTTWVPDNHNTWNGCVTDRQKEFDVDNKPADSSNKNSLFPAEQYEACPAVAVQPLTSNFLKLNTAIGQMVPDGNTNQTIGLV